MDKSANGIDFEQKFVVINFMLLVWYNRGKPRKKTKKQRSNRLFIVFNVYLFLLFFCRILFSEMDLLGKSGRNQNTQHTHIILYRQTEAPKINNNKCSIEKINIIQSKYISKAPCTTNIRNEKAEKLKQTSREKNLEFHRKKGSNENRSMGKLHFSFAFSFCDMFLLAVILILLKNKERTRKKTKESEKRTLFYEVKVFFFFVFLYLIFLCSLPLFLT